MNKQSDNRRRFFRIVDALGVAYRVVNGQQARLGEQSAMPESGFINTQQLVQGYDSIIKDSLVSLQARDPSAAMAIDQLNKKVDTLLRMLELDNLLVQYPSHHVEQASISASGIAFPAEEKIPLQSTLALDLILRPSSQHIKAIGRVVACDSLREMSQYYLRVEFIEISEPDRERLIQHIVQRQGALLRALKNEIDDMS